MHTRVDFRLECFIVGGIAFAAKANDDITGEYSRIEKLPADCARTTPKSITDYRVATFVGGDDSDARRTASHSIGDEVIRHTLVPASNHMAEIARFNNSVCAGEH